MSVCPSCHSQVRATDYFCFNCGKNLRPAPLDVSLAKQIVYYLGSFFLPPLGFWWGIKYLRGSSESAKRAGIICIVLTLISLFITFMLMKSLSDTVNKQVNNELPNIMSF